MFQIAHSVNGLLWRISNVASPLRCMVVFKCCVVMTQSIAFSTPLPTSSFLQACAWIPSCTIAGCESKCVANIFGENKLMESVENMLQSAMLCSMISTLIGAGDMMNMNSESRRLQVRLSVLGGLPAHKPSHKRHLACRVPKSSFPVFSAP